MASRPYKPRNNNPESRKDLLIAIRSFQRTNGFPPTIRELGEALGLTIGGVQYHLELLRVAGAVTWVDKKPRTLRVLDNIKLGDRNEQDA